MSLNGSGEEGRTNILGRLLGGLKALFSEPELKGESQETEADELCCSGVVHISYRGVSDDRLYMAYHRKWAEVKFFRQNNLRVFCADCRQRLL